MGEEFPLDPSQVQPPEEAQPDSQRPKTAEELVQDLDSEVSKPDSELAVQGIDHQIADLARQRKGIDQSVAFTRKYEPTHPGPAPHPEAGGMDHEELRLRSMLIMIEMQNYEI